MCGVRTVLEIRQPREPLARERRALAHGRDHVERLEVVDVVVMLREDDDLGVEAVPVGEAAGDVLVVVEDRDAGHEPALYQGSASTAAWSAAEP
jgi:hypothetical protein